jgi:hypothetical protein
MRLSTTRSLSIGFLMPEKGACLGKSASTFHEGANFNTGKKAGYQTRSHKKSEIIAEEYCQQRKDKLRRTARITRSRLKPAWPSNLV